MSFFYYENKLLEEKLADYLNEIKTVTKNKYGNRFSLVLIGSMSRNEATWEKTESGSLLLMSDIEFLLVYQCGLQNIDKIEKDIQDIGYRILGDYASPLFHIDISSIPEDRVPMLERKLLIYDAKAFGKTVAGRDVVPELPEITIHNINLFDIRDILLHRAYAIITYGFPFRESGNIIEYQYVLAKNSLDLMTVFLVERGILISGFENRCRKIQSMDVDEELKLYFEFCLSKKIGTECRKQYLPEQMEKIFFGLLDDLHRNFKIHPENVWNNKAALTRRICGIIRRSIRKKCLPKASCYKNTYRHLIHFEALSSADKKNQYVIYGYPES